MDCRNKDSQAVSLAASEYPISIDTLLPTSYFGQNENDSKVSIDTLTAPSTIQHNSIHRHTLSTRTITHYCRLEQIGEGTYGQVYRAKCLTPTLTRPKGGEMVALKKIRLHHPGYWGIPPTVIREIKILKKLQHKNMVKMFEVVSSKGVDELDWEDEREDEKRKKEHKSNENNNATPLPLANRENIESLMAGRIVEKSSKLNDDKKGVSMQISSHVDSTKKKKKDSMSDLDKLRESYKGNLFLVLEYISHDLTGLLDMANKFTEVQTKSIIKQLLEVLEYMHVRNYVHRDLKSSNVLITDKYEVKLADFGLARCLETSFNGGIGCNDYNSNVNSNEGEYTNKVITLWYRPPELLLGETRYGTAVDIWSAGCILAEIILGRPIFTGKTDMDQLKLIFDLIGTPTERSWEGFNELKLIRTGEVTIDRVKRPKLREKYGTRIQPATALSLIEKLLELDPKKRLTAARALHHRYFQTEPVAPEDARDLGTINLGGDGSGYHEFQTKKRRREAKTVAKNAEEEAKKRGEGVEKQKEAFDKAYRDHLQKGASAESKKGKMQWQPWEQQKESCPWEEYQEQEYQHQHDLKRKSEGNRYFQSCPTNVNHHPRLCDNFRRPLVQPRTKIQVQDMPPHAGDLTNGGRNEVQGFHDEVRGKDDQMFNRPGYSAPLDSGHGQHGPPLTHLRHEQYDNINEYNGRSKSTNNAYTLDPRSVDHEDSMSTQRHTENKDWSKRESRKIGDCMENETHQSKLEEEPSAVHLPRFRERTGCRGKPLLSTHKSHNYDRPASSDYYPSSDHHRGRSTDGPDSHSKEKTNHNYDRPASSDYHPSSDHHGGRSSDGPDCHSKEKTKDVHTPSFPSDSGRMSTVTLAEVDTKVNNVHNAKPSKDGSHCKDARRETEGQQDNRGDAAMLKQGRALDRDDDTSGEHSSRHHYPLSNNEGMKNMDVNSRDVHMNVSSRNEQEMSEQDGSYPKVSLDGKRQSTDSVGDGPSISFVPPVPVRRQYDRYGNPVGESTKPSGHDRNRISQDSWGEQRNRDRSGYNFNGPNRPPEWGPPRGVGVGRPSEQGRHQSWPRNRCQDKEDNCDTRR